MILSKITNNDPIGIHICQIITEEVKTDRFLMQYQDQANRAIKHYLDKPANAENCQALKGYLEHALALCNNRPESNGKSELVNMITDVIDTLQTGIDREEQKYYTTPSTPDKNFVSWTERLQRSYQRWEVIGWRNRPIKTDLNTIEGYLRSIPGIEKYDFLDLMNTFGMVLIKKFFTVPDTEDLQILLRFVDNCTYKIIDKFTFVKLTTNKPTIQVIEDRFDDDDVETASATITIEPLVYENSEVN